MIRTHSGPAASWCRAGHLTDRFNHGNLLKRWHRESHFSEEEVEARL